MKYSSSVFKGAAHFLSPEGRKGRVNIFRYHGIRSPEDKLETGHISASEFEWQMKWINKNMEVMSLSEVEQALAGDYIPRRAACITFDDGYFSSFAIGATIIKSLRMTATYFVSSGYLGGGILWNDMIRLALERTKRKVIDLSPWELGSVEVENKEANQSEISRVVEALKYLPAEKRDAAAKLIVSHADVDLSDCRLMMSFAELKELVGMGMTVGSHTRKHLILTTAGLDELERDIIADKRVLEEVTGLPVRYFAYPNGRPGRDYGAEHVGLLRKLGFTLAVTTGTGTATSGSDPFQLPRFTPWRSNSLSFGRQIIWNYFATGIPKGS